MRLGRVVRRAGRTRRRCDAVPRRGGGVLRHHVVARRIARRLGPNVGRPHPLASHAVPRHRLHRRPPPPRPPHRPRRRRRRTRHRVARPLRRAQAARETHHDPQLQPTEPDCGDRYVARPAAVRDRLLLRDAPDQFATDARTERARHAEDVGPGEDRRVRREAIGAEGRAARRLPPRRVTHDATAGRHVDAPTQDLLRQAERRRLGGRHELRGPRHLLHPRQRPHRRRVRTSRRRRRRGRQDGGRLHGGHARDALGRLALSVSRQRAAVHARRQRHRAGAVATDHLHAVRTEQSERLRERYVRTSHLGHSIAAVTVLVSFANSNPANDFLYKTNLVFEIKK